MLFRFKSKYLESICSLDLNLSILESTCNLDLNLSVWNRYAI